MANLALAFDILARDKGASKTFDNVGKSAETAGKKATVSGKDFNTAFGLVGLGAIAAGASVVKFGADSIEAYKDAAKQHRVLEDAYKRFPAIADKSIRSMDDQAAALSKVTKFDDDAISSTQGLLAQYKLTGTQIQQLIPLILDYAEKTGKDLPTATETVGKALLGQGRALKEIGINFKDTGSTAGNFTELMGGLRKQVGGFAEQEGKSAEGRAAILANQFGNLQEAIGEKLLPAVEFTTDRLSDLVNVASNLGNAIGQVPTPALAAAGAFTVWQIAGEKITSFASRGVAPIKSWADSIRLAGLYAKDAGGGFAGLKAGAASLTGGLGGLKAAGSGLFGLLGGPWGAAITGATALFASMFEEIQKGQAQVDAVRNSLADLAKAGDLTPAKKLEQFFQIFKDDLPEIRVHLQKAGISWEEYTHAIATGGPELDNLADRLALAGSNAGIFGDHLGNTINITDRWNSQQKTAAQLGKDEATALDKLGGAAKDAAPAVDDVAQAQRDAAESAAALAAEQAHAAAGIDAHNKALQTIQGSLADVGNATDELTQIVQDRAQAQADATKSTKDGWQDYAAGVKLSARDIVKTLDEQTNAAKKWRDNLLIVQKQGDEQFTAWVSQQPAAVAQAYASGTEKQKKAIYDAYKRNVGEQQALGIADGLKAGESTVTDAAGNVYTATKDKLTGQMILIPVGVKAPSVQLLRTVAGNILRAIGTLHIPLAPTSVPHISPVNRRGGGPIPGYASGTLIGPGTGTSDSILARVEQTGRFLRVSAGEFVSTDASRRRNEYALEAGNRGAALQVAQSAPTTAGDYVRLHRHDITLLAQEIAKYRLPAVVERRNLMSSFADGAS